MIKKIVLTGAGGRLGSYIREPISKICESLVSSDIKEDIGKLYKNEQYLKADISIYDEIEPIIQDATICLLYTSPSPRDISGSRMPSSA